MYLEVNSFKSRTCDYVGQSECKLSDKGRSSHNQNLSFMKLNKINLIRL